MEIDFLETAQDFSRGVLQLTAATNSQDGDLTSDYTQEAVALRKVFRKLSLPSRRLVVDFAQMLVKQTAV